MRLSELRKSAYRAVRYNRWIEHLQNALRREAGVSFPEIGLFVPVGANDILIDAGANVGDVTSRFARTGATVHAFEPNPACYQILQKRFAGLSNVRIHHAGIMDKSCALKLSTPKPTAEYDSIESTVAASFFAPIKDAEIIEIPCIDFEAFVRSLPRPVALLKMDVEGAEVPVLNQLLDTGAIGRIQMAVVETHERLSPELAEATGKLRKRIDAAGLSRQVRLDWI